MLPAVVYLAGVLVTGIAMPPAVSVGVGDVGVSAGTMALTWPVSLPLLAGYGAMSGAESVLTPDEPGKRQLVGLNSKTGTAGRYVDCQSVAIPISEIAAQGGYSRVARDHARALVNGPADVVANWRGGAVAEDKGGEAPSVVADWVGNRADTARNEVAELRTCTLKPIPAQQKEAAK